ncbi:hypothetical protein ACIGW3_26240 [Streptomyces sp. NPDC053499]|uniref:hypothetical protein n=1 Tax=Streptomyces sp. NPDC053499 TaxID=3365707 RepID=UPI0037D35DCB
MPKGRRAKGIAPGRVRVYERLKQMYGKARAARIANAGKTRAGRKQMARKAARNRKS